MYIISIYSVCFSTLSLMTLDDTISISRSLIFTCGGLHHVYLFFLCDATFSQICRVYAMSLILWGYHISKCRSIDVGECAITTKEKWDKSFVLPGHEGGRTWKTPFLNPSHQVWKSWNQWYLGKEIVHNLLMVPSQSGAMEQSPEWIGRGPPARGLEPYESYNGCSGLACRKCQMRSSSAMTV